MLYRLPFRKHRPFDVNGRGIRIGGAYPKISGSPVEAMDFPLLSTFFRDPVVSSTDLFFLYSRLGGGRTRTVFLSPRFSPDAPWPDGVELATATRFDAVADDRFEPTGLSGDGRTLFLWHEAEMLEYAVIFDLAQKSFEASLSLGGLSGAMPNADCSRLYFDSAGVSPDLFFAATR